MMPYGALPGFSLASDVREIGAYYRVRYRSLRNMKNTDESIAEARHALFWKLTQRRQWSPERVAGLLHCAASTVRAGAAKHAERIAAFREENRVADGSAAND